MSADHQLNSISLADKINKNKFLTNSDHKKIIQDTDNMRKAELKSHNKDRLYETFWSDFDLQH